MINVLTTEISITKSSVHKINIKLLKIIKSLSNKIQSILKVSILVLKLR